jgi:crotonobetainyl-CoA:carnitine CoA-transferase CaiB-like acyl-CoA transferase
MIPYDLASLMMRQLSRLDPEIFPPDSLGARLRLLMLQYIPVRTKDGHWLQHANLMDRLFRSYLKAVGLGWVLQEDLFKNAPIMNHESREALRELILNKMQERTLLEWMEVYMADGNIAAGPFLYARHGMKHEQFVHNSHASEIADPRVGRPTTVGLLARLSAIDWDTCRRINPRLVHVYVGAYGATGPHRKRPGAHPIPGALLGGALRQAGRANPPTPDRPMNLEEIKGSVPNSPLRSERFLWRTRPMSGNSA